MTPEPLSQDALRQLTARCTAFRGAWNGRAALQLAGNLAGLLGLYLAMGVALVRDAGLALPLLWVPAAVMLVRLFVVQHDCGHGSFFSTRRANVAAGWLVSLLTFTPYGFWRFAHNRHHATSGDLDRQGVGDVFTCSVAQYNAMSAHDQRRYHRFRNPVVMILLGAPIQFLLRYRTPFLQPVPPSQCWRSILGLDLGLLVVYGAAAYLVGLATVALVVLPVVVLTTWIGAWLFFVQHQFERGFWRRHDEWSFHEASLYGSSYYALPPFLRWCTGNIGLHHIHHLCSAIPNYRLQACLRAVPELEGYSRITLRESLRFAHLALWDEASGTMISFRQALELGRIS